MNLDALKERWQNFSTNKKILIVTLGVSFFVIVFLIGSWLTKTEYASLMTNLDTRDASAVVSKLQEFNIPYQLGPEGKSILVPKEQVYDVRLKLASEGIFEGGGLGFELFDETKLGVTDFERRLNYQRALQEELRRTILQLDEVENARVHIVLPEKSVFVEDEKSATASIALKLKPLGKLKPEQVKGLIHLVASSVEGLPVENVNIIDMNGNILSQDVLTEGSDYEVKNMFAQQKDFEKEIEQKVQGMLEKILGPGKAVAMVTAELDFNQEQTTEIVYGKDGVIRSQQIVEDNATSTGGGEIPTGTGSNTDPDGYPAVNPGESESNHKDETLNYEVDKRETTTIKAPGTLKRLSTAVSVDGVLNNNLVAQIENMVSAATGYSQERGDQIFVSSLDFDTSQAEKLDAEMEKVATAEAEKLKKEAYIKWALIGVAGLVILVFAIILIRSIAKTYAGPELDQTFDEPIAIRDIDSDPVVEEKDEVWESQREVKKYTENEPDEVANLLKVWLAEDRG